MSPLLALEWIGVVFAAVCLTVIVIGLVVSVLNQIRKGAK